MSNQTVEKWGVYEASFEGPSKGNPYLEVDFYAILKTKEREVRVPGFYDGDGVYKLRYMPETLGVWSFETHSDTSSLNGKNGSFEVVQASKDNHGPVRVRNKFHFAYADGKPFLSFGTTCYAWTHQPLLQQEETLTSLEKAGFNKVRMGIFPKDYAYNVNEALYDIYHVVNGNRDFDQPNFDSFRHFETQILRLQKMGIEADLIMFHPYDRWGYSEMSESQDYRYVAYIAARFGAYRNVWWSLANEYDFMIDTKPMERWDRFFQILEEEDPHQHLKSIHNGKPDANYDHRKPWVTHSCLQHWDVKRTQEWRDRWGKPVINDEPEYEGNLIQSWGSISAQELTHRFWLTIMRGGYAGHGETYNDDNDFIWWAKGGELKGKAWKRIAFMRELLEKDTVSGFEPLGPLTEFPWSRISGSKDNDTTYIYFGEHQPIIWAKGLPLEDGDYELDLIDVWNMTIEPLQKVAAPENHPIRHGSFNQTPRPHAAFAVELPGRPYLAIRCKKKT